MTYRAAKTSRESQDPGWWEHKVPAGYTIMFKCPDCGALGALATPPVEVLKEDGHRVLPGGHVQPSVVCTTTGCGFHRMVELEGYVAR